MKYLNATEFADRHKISKQRVMQWIHDKRLSCWNIATGIYMIPETEMRPDRLKPGRPTNYSKSLVFDK